MRMSPDEARHEAETIKAARIIRDMKTEGYGWEDICKTLRANRLPYNSVRVRKLVLTNDRNSSDRLPEPAREDHRAPGNNPHP